MPQKNMKELLSKFLIKKSKYHNEMQNYYSEKSKTSQYKKELCSIAKSEEVHSKLLQNPSEDIIKSEAIKIQMANFIFVSGQHCKNHNLKFNLEQITNYYNEGLNYFEKEFEKAKNAKDNNRKIYYRNCINLFKGWNRVLRLSEIMNKDQRTRITKSKIRTLEENL